MHVSMWSSYLLRLCPKPEDAVLYLKKHGYSYAELSDEHAAVLLNRPEGPEAAGRHFRTFCESLDFSCPQAHFMLYSALDDPDEAKRRTNVDVLKRWCDLFQGLGVRAGVLHPAAVSTVGSDQKALVAPCLETLLRHSEGMSFTICLENLITSYTTCGDLLSLIGQTPGGERLGICLDTGHANKNGVSCADFVRQAGSSLKALHITDSYREVVDHFLPYGPGTVDWSALMGALKEVGYSGLFNYEVPRETGCPEPVLSAKLSYARSLGDYLVGLAG